MSRIYDALKKLEAERQAHRSGDAGGRNGGRNGNAGGNGDAGNGKRHGWRRLFGNGNGGKTGHEPVTISFDLDPKVEDAYQRLGTNLFYPGAPEIAAPAPRLLAVTASRHREGTTTTAAVFASILVRRRGCRVAVVEANFRSPTFETVFGTPRNGGFAELVNGRGQVGAIALATEVPNLYAVGCGQSTLSPSVLCDAPGLPAALDQLREQFGFVIFDLPPVNVYADASILAPRLDATVLVIEADRTRLPDVERARRSLERVGVKLEGSVLNRRRNYIPGFLEEML